MQTTTIGNWNLKNRPNLGIDDQKERANLIKKFIMEQDIDLLGTQEITADLLKLIDLEKNFNIYGSYRNDSIPLITLIPEANKWNEGNLILNAKNSSHHVYDDNTVNLPTFPLILTNPTKANPRIMTEVMVFNEDNYFTHMNTHLSTVNTNVQIKQMKFILKEIKKCVEDNIPVFLTGVFNQYIKEPQFIEFINLLEQQYHIKLVDNLKPTYISNEILNNGSRLTTKKINSYIFYSDNAFEPIQTEVVDVPLDNNGNRISDHQLIYTKFESKKVR